MNIIRKRAYARAALVGNPSDGYGGRTLSLVVRNFSAEVVLYEWDTVEIMLTEEDRARFRSVQDLALDVSLHGYYGGIRLIKATVKRFVDYCRTAGVTLHDQNFTIRYHTNIPRQVGLAGSSAIITATLRCLMEFYDVDVPLVIQPSLVLSVERDELRVAAGLQDRVAQTYEGLVYMDFGAEHERQLHKLRYYQYEPLDPRCCRHSISLIITASASPLRCLHRRAGALPARRRGRGGRHAASPTSPRPRVRCFDRNAAGCRGS
jgi:glucuronokinase